MTLPTPADLDRLLGPGGPVAGALAVAGGGWEPRPQQVEMAGAVATALSSGRHLLAEAGTGVGKSFAYLVPLLAWAAEQKAVAAVATSTIALQEQLVRKDLPLLQSCLPFDVSFTLVKGRGNYLCLRRLFQALDAAPMLFAEEGPVRELAAIRDWSDQETSGGSLQDLPFRPRPEVWDQVRAEQGNCKGRACSHHERCPYQESRRRSHRVRCLVLNHHVLLADLALRRSGASFLPKVGALVVDEAHDLEDVAAEHLGARVSSLGAALLLGRLWSPERRKGLLAGARDEHLRKAVAAARDASRGFFEALQAWTEGGGGNGEPRAIGPDFPVADTLSPRLRELARRLEDASGVLQDEDAALEIGARTRQVADAADTLASVVASRPGEVRWAERGPRGSVLLASAPVHVGPLLHEVLWSRFPTVVLTSATLATGRPPTFAFLRERLGLSGGDEVAVGSPFDYPRQARLRVRADLPDPVADPEGYAVALPSAVLEAVRLLQGGAFVLFTGYHAMRRTVEALRADLASDGHEVLVQGEGLERPALLARFRAGGAVLFGVSSFWQGVDVPGDALRHVVIARLPFDVPSHPLQKARQERLEATGRSAFVHLSLPLAALRLKQGFGRLIRTRTDRGVVTILDPRIVTRRYGRFLLDSLPRCPVEAMGGAEAGIPAEPPEPPAPGGEGPPEGTGGE